MGGADFDAVLTALRAAAKDHTEITTDTVWLYLSQPPTERNVIGKAFSEAARLKIIEGTERFVKSGRREAKGRRVQVWRVLR